MAPTWSSMSSAVGQVSALTLAAGLGIAVGYAWCAARPLGTQKAGNAARETVEAEIAEAATGRGSTPSSASNAPARKKVRPGRVQFAAEAVVQKPLASSGDQATRKGSPESASKREVHCMDAIEWLKRPGSVPASAAIFTSLPDASEVKEFAPTLADWEAWFFEAVRSVLHALPLGAIAIFYQTDIRVPEVGQVSKAFVVLRAAATVPGCKLQWHKIVHFGNVDQPSHSSLVVKFTHLLSFRKEDGDVEAGKVAGRGQFPGVADWGGMIPDVVDRGQKPWGIKNAMRCMGAGATMSVLKAIHRRLPQVDTIVDPFCGAGTVLAIANHLGLHAIGVDLSPKRVKQAKVLDGAALLAGRSAGGGPGGRDVADEDDEQDGNPLGRQQKGGKVAKAEKVKQRQ